MTELERVVERFHALLVEEIRAQRPEYLNAPFTVAEIYQNLVPYATHRDRLGVEMNGDYEDALVRLLAGEGGYLRLESDAAIRDLREELERTNPNTGIYREFAAVDVRLSAPARAAGGTPATEVAVPEAVEPPTAPAPDPEPPRASSKAPSRTGASAGADPAGPVGRADDGACRWCNGALPDRPGLRYCPHCGGDVGVAPCPQCGEELETGWRFCIACGTEVGP